MASGGDRNLYSSCGSEYELEAWRSSEPSSDDVQSRIRNLLMQAHSNVQRLDLQISTTKDILSALLSKKVSETQQISFLSGAISPLKKIPSEVLGDIFVLCGDGEPIIIPPQPHTYPWPLAQVCSRWRRALWGTSQIWKNIEVRAKPPRILSSDQEPVPMAVKSIVLHTTSQFSLMIPRGINDSLVNVILGFPDRFRTLDLAIDHRLFHRLLASPSGSFRALETLKISLWGIEQDLPPLETTSLQSAPNLHRVTIEVDDLNCHLPYLFLLPWDRLTDVRLPHTKIAPNIIHSILQQCVSLVTVQLLIGVDYKPPSATPIKIVLPKLKSITLTGIRLSRDRWAAFLCPLILPLLDEFSVRLTANAWDPENLISLVNRSACYPRVLSIISGSAEADNLDTLLRVLPRLTYLNTSLVIPPSIFQAILRDGLAQDIKHISCRVHMDGLYSFADLMQQHSLAGCSVGLKSASIKCYVRVEDSLLFKNLAQTLHGYRREKREIIVAQRPFTR